MEVFEQLANAVGWAWFVAAGLEFLSVAMDGAAGAKRISADELAEQRQGKGFAARAIAVASGLSTVFLFAHVLFTATVGNPLIVLAAGFSIMLAIVLFGAAIGRGLAMLAPRVSVFAQSAKLPFAFAALGMTLFATLPSVVQLVTLVTGFFF